MTKLMLKLKYTPTLNREAERSKSIETNHVVRLLINQQMGN